MRKGTFGPYDVAAPVSDQALTREAAIVAAAEAVPVDAAIVATTGLISRELFAYRAGAGQGHGTDFLTVGGMGHASQIAMGLALHRPGRPVYCFDGDGAALMHLGSLGISGTSGLTNFVHLVFNNGVHDSVGGQPTVGFRIDLPAIARACGYRSVQRVETVETLTQAMEVAASSDGPAFIEVRVRPGHRRDIGRPTEAPAQNKAALTAFLAGG